MPRTRPKEHFRWPLNAILGSQSKLAALRTLGGSSVPLSCQALSRRSGMTHRAVTLALDDLRAVGIVVPAGGGHERLYRVNAAHRLTPAIEALFRAEADTHAAMRAELSAAVRGAPNGVLGASLVGAGADGREKIGDEHHLICVVADRQVVRAWSDRFVAVSNGVAARYGTPLRVTVYDQATARRMWATRTPAAYEAVLSADLIAGRPLLELVESIGSA